MRQNHQQEHFTIPDIRPTGHAFAKGRVISECLFVCLFVTEEIQNVFVMP